VDLFDWIERTLEPRLCTSVELMYDDMDSQSGWSLPVIYQPFDAGQRAHWMDRGALFDYLFSTQGGKLLDFGPGDGWPSLIVAPFVEEVVGVEGSHRRVEVCAENARRLGLSNVRFVYVEPGNPLPFEDDSFDGVMAASSVEQTPDPQSTLRELFRILHPGGHLRIGYESLDRYRGGLKREAWLLGIDGHTCRLILVDRDIDGERARQYGLTLAMPRGEVEQRLARGHPLSLEVITIPALEELRPAMVDVLFCPLVHPSGRTLTSWLKDIGFQEIAPSHSGAWFAGQLFDRLPEVYRPRGIEGVDAMLRPIVGVVVQMAAPMDTDPMITAVK